MITAQEVRQSMPDSESKLLENYLIDIEKKIIKNKDRGSHFLKTSDRPYSNWAFSTNPKGSIGGLFVDRLIEVGFQVSSFSDESDSGMIISWFEEE